MSPTARSLAFYRAYGMRAHVVERWIPRARRRVDLFGFIDIVCITHGRAIFGIQATTTSNLAARVTKIRLHCAAAAREWLEAGGHLAVHGWSKKGPRGKRKVWTLTERIITLADLEQ